MGYRAATKDLILEAQQGYSIGYEEFEYWVGR